jgi:hypothetical protein
VASITPCLTRKLLKRERLFAKPIITLSVISLATPPFSILGIRTLTDVASG